MAVFSVGPFAINLSGTSIYLYINFGSKDLIFGASQGISHNAFADAIEFGQTDDSGLLDGYLEEMGYNYSEFVIGPFAFLAESNGRFRPYRFSMRTDVDYLSVEFPWLLIPICLGALGYWRYRKARPAMLQPNKND